MILNNPGFDKLYIENWLKEFDTTFQDTRFTDSFKNVLKESSN
jgi:hypothetical protein